MSDPTEKDRERADGLADYLAQFTSGKGFTEADCIFDALQETRADERARIVAALRHLVRVPAAESVQILPLHVSPLGAAGSIAHAIESGEL